MVEQESGWDTFAIRYESAFYAIYVAPHLSDGTEARSRAMSWGLMQLMGETAREIGFTGSFLSGLCDPTAGLHWGCLLLKKKLVAKQGNVVNALLAWNGGSVKSYPQQVMARIHKYAD